MRETDGFVVKLHRSCLESNRDRYRPVPDDD
jgi:hypothetical protein